MKAATFDYVRPTSLREVCRLLAAAVVEEFKFDEAGQLVAGTFVDYLLPSAHEVPQFQGVEYCTPSPLTSHGQKGSGAGGDLGAPAEIASAVNDVLARLGVSLHALPMRMSDLEAAIRQSRCNDEARTP